MSIHQAAEALGVSTRTLARWEEKGYFLPERIPDTNIRLYHSYSVGYQKRILDLDRSINKHLKLLEGLKKRLDDHGILQEYIPGRPLKLLSEEDMKQFSDAYDAMEIWEKEYKSLLDELMKYPRQMLKTTIEAYENSNK